jgi:hypothetical protein
MQKAFFNKELDLTLPLGNVGGNDPNLQPEENVNPNDPYA